jgi:EAL domain-containing protein (putative c-di-GMP-specific phosphodiesterase class I)
VFTISSIFKFESSDELTKSIPFFIADNKKEYSNFVSEIDQKRIDYIKYKMNISELVDYSIENDSIAIEYQPIYSIKEKRFTSAEALVRLIDKNGNIIYPQAFIDMVENDERIIPMGKLVFKHVCEFISKNNLEDLGLKYIEVNLSPAQCRKENFAFDLIEIVKKYHVNPKIINIEITEKAAAKQKDLIFAM